jgi:hypothetical protein
MLRSRSIAKILLVFTVCIPAAAQQSFSSYVSHQRNQTVDRIERQFLTDCGVSSAGEERVLAINRTSAEGPGKWERRKTLSRGNWEAESDFFDTAEVRLVAGKPRALNLWFLVMDIGQEFNALICLSETGTIRFARAVTEMTPVDGSGPGWTYVQVRHFDNNGNVKDTSSYFADKDDRHVSRPKLDRDDASILGWNPDHSAVADVLRPLGLPDKGKGR